MLNATANALLKAALEPSLKAPFIEGSEIEADNRWVSKPTLLPSFKPRPRLGQRLHLARPAAAALALLMAACLLPAQAKDRDRSDHDRARSAVEAGTALPLPALLEKLQRTHPGQVLELELERDDGRWIYEVKLLHNNGQLLKIKLDAATGALLEVKQRSADKTSDRSSDKSRERGKSPPALPPKTP